MASARQIKAGSAYVEVLLDKSPFLRGLRSLETDFKTVGRRIATVGSAIFAGAASLASPFVLAVKLFADAASELQDVADRTGVAASALSGLSFAASQTGSDLKGLEKALIGQNKVFLQLQQGSKGAVEIFDALGISAKTFAGLNQEKRFLLLVDRLSKVDDMGTRAALSMKVFGKAGFQLGPLISGGAAGIKELTDRAEQLGITLSDEDIASGEAFGDTIAQVIDAVKGVKNQVGAALIATFQGPTKAVASFIGVIANFIKVNRDLVAGIFKTVLTIGAVGAGLVALGLSFAAVGVAIGGIISAFTALFSIGSAVAAIIGFLISPFGILATVVVGGAAAFLTYTDSGRQMIDFLTKNFGQFYSQVTKVFKGIAKAVGAGDLQLAVNILWTGVELAWITGKQAILGETQDLRKRVNEGFIDLMYGAQSAAIQGWSAIVTTFSEFGRLIVDGVAAVSNEIQGNFLEPISQDLAKFFAWLTTPIGDTAALAEAERSIDDTFADKAREREKRFLDGVLAREQSAKGLTSARTTALEAEIARLREEAALAKDILGEKDTDRLAVLNEQIKAKSEQLAALLGTADEIDLAGGGAFDAKLKSFFDQGFLDDFGLGDQLKKQVAFAVDEIKSVSTFSSTEAGRTAGFLAGKQKNPNEKLETLTDQGNRLSQEQLAAFKNLEVAT